MNNLLTRLSRTAIFSALALAPAIAHAQSDSFASPTVITTLPVTGTNVGATRETGEVNHCNNGGGASVWYSWTATTTGYYNVDLINSDFDTMLGVYTGTAVDGLTALAWNDDRVGGASSTAVVYVRAGETVLIAVDGYLATTTPATGNISLDITPLSPADVPPANDLFANATDLGNTATAVSTVNTSFGSREVGEPAIENMPGGSSLWWTWTAPATATVTIDTSGTAFDTLLAVYTGSDLNALTLVASNNNDGALTTSKVTIPATAGTQYRIAADVRFGTLRLASGNLTVRVGGTGGPTGPANDNFANAAALTSLPAAGTNTGASKETGEPNHAANAGGASVWYSWTATADGYYRVDLINSTFDTLLGIYTGASVDALQPVTQNDDRGAGAGQQSQAVIYAKSGQVFYIAVDGYNSGTVTANGTIALNVSPLPVAEVPPANDLFANAASLGTAASTQVTVNTAYGSREVGEPLIANVVGGTSLWWTWTAPATTEAEITTAGTTFNTLLAVYTGNALNALTLVASNDNDGAATTSRVTFNAVAGTQYRIAADVANTAFTMPTGNLTLRLSASVYIRTLIPHLSTWAWLHPQGGIDPSTSDLDFNTTWYNSTAYDGPAFNTAAPAILAYGGIDYGPTATNITDPLSGNRFTAYFRRSFTATENHPRLRADVLADDGAIIYVDGVERGRVNMDSAVTDSFGTFALDATNTETALVTVDLGAITAGAHEIAVSIHNSSATSSDLGFDLRLYTDSTPAPVDFVLGPAGAFTGFEEAVPASTSYLFGSNGQAEIGWIATDGGTVRAPSSHPATAGNTPANQYFSLNSARTNPFHTDRISLTNLTDADKANIVASASVRTFTTSTTTFESLDDLTIRLEGSDDGTTFTTLAEILPLTAGGTPDALLAISADTNDFVPFSTAAGAVPATTAFLRVAIIGGTDSDSEYIYIDNVRVTITGAVDPSADSDGDGQTNGSEAVAGTDPNNAASVLRIASAAQSGGNLDLSFPGVAGKVYQVEYSPTLVSGWTVLQDNISAAVTETVNVTGLVLPQGTAGFLRVKVKP